MSPSFRRSPAAVAMIAGLAIACTHVQSTRFDLQGATGRRTSPSAIRFYEGLKPRCEYREVGHLSVKQGWFVSWNSVVEKARERASDIGGDAIVSFRESTRISGATVSRDGISTRESTTLSGTVIRFTNQGCRE